MYKNIVLDVVDLNKVYEGDNFQVKALKNVNLQLFKGEIIAIMGTSGSGKSTLLNILGALDHPTTGSITIDGVNQNNMFNEPAASLYRQENIGFIFQSFHLLKDLTVFENLSLPLVIKDCEKNSIEEKVNSMLGQLGLEKWKNHRPVQLSGGQQQRVAIGRALITEPPIILADEPTGNLDFNTSNDILDILISTKGEKSQSIIIVTHDANVASYADRVLFFHDGEIVDEYICSQSEQDIEMVISHFKQISMRHFL